MGSFAFAQSKTPSLADAARENRKTKAQSGRTVWTNENISAIDNKDAAPSAAPAATPAAAEAEKAPAAETAEVKEAKKECDKTKDADCGKTEEKSTAELAAEKSDGYKKKLKGMQDDLADLQKEASVNEREWKLAQAAYYGDAGTQLRNQKSFSDDQSGHQKDTERLQKAIQDQQKKIEDFKEAARKDGVSL
jgi:hypothetical protein